MCCSEIPESRKLGAVAESECKDQERGRERKRRSYMTKERKRERRDIIGKHRGSWLRLFSVFPGLV